MNTQQREEIIKLVDFVVNPEYHDIREWKTVMSNWDTWAFGILDFRRVATFNNDEQSPPSNDVVENLGMDIYRSIDDDDYTVSKHLKRYILEMAEILTKENGYDYKELLTPLKENKGN